MSSRYLKESCPFCNGRIDKKTRLCTTCNIAFPKGQGVSIKWHGNGYRPDSDEGGPLWENCIRQIEDD